MAYGDSGAFQIWVSVRFTPQSLAEAGHHQVPEPIFQDTEQGRKQSQLVLVKVSGY